MQSYVHILHRGRFLVIILWILIAVIGGFLSPKFLANTDNAMRVPFNSPSSVANRAMQRHFPSNITGGLVLYVEEKECCIAGEALEVLSKKLRDDVDMSNLTLGLDGWWYALQRGLVEKAAGYVWQNCSSIIVVSIQGGMDGGVVAQWLQGRLKEDATRNGLTAYVLGEDAFMDIIQSSVEHDMAIGDGISLPLSLFVFCWTLVSVRVVLVPLVVVILAGLSSFGMMWFFSLAIPVMSATMSLMSSILIAFSIDYSLFLLSRFLEEARGVRVGNSPAERQEAAKAAVVTMLQTGGHTVLVSGLTLACSCFGIMIVPQPTLRGIGLGSGVAVLFVLAVHLTVTPALLLMFPSFWLNAAAAPPCKALHPPSEVSEEEQLTQSRFYKVGMRLTHRWWNVGAIVIVCAVTLPFAIFAFSYPLSNSVVVALPSGNPITEAFVRMNSQFGWGELSPYNFLLVPPPTMGDSLPPSYFLTNSSWLASLSLFLDTLQSTTHVNCSTLATYLFVRCQSIPAGVILLCLQDPNALPQCKELIDLYHGHVSSSAVTISVSLDWDPSGPEGEVFYRDALRFVDEWNGSSQSRVYISGGGGWDGVFLTYNWFPFMILITTLVVLLFLGVCFRSVLIPLRAAATIAISLLFVYGANSLIYVYGVLDWMHFWGFQKMGALLWMPPIVSFSIVVGLSLDYDLFLLVRVQEYHRLDLYSTEECISRGLYHTGKIITSAGIIMAIAFSSLLFSATPAMNLLSAFLVLAVLYDTFVVRILLVPALFSIGAQWNWWPGSQFTKKVPKSFLSSASGEALPLIREDDSSEQ